MFCNIIRLIRFLKPFVYKEEDNTAKNKCDNNNIYIFKQLIYIAAKIPTKKSSWKKSYQEL